MIGKSRGCVSYFELGFKSTKSLLPALTGVAVEVDIVGQYCLYCLLSRTNRLLRPSDKCFSSKRPEEEKKGQKRLLFLRFMANRLVSFGARKTTSKEKINFLPLLDIALVVPTLTIYNVFFQLLLFCILVIPSTTCPVALKSAKKVQKFVKSLFTKKNM